MDDRDRGGVLANRTRRGLRVKRFSRAVVEAIRLEHFASHAHVHNQHFRSRFRCFLRRAVDESQRSARGRAHWRHPVRSRRFSRQLFREPTLVALLQIALGAVYAWSVFRIPLAKQFGWSISEVTLTFTISIFVLGFAAFFRGLWVNRKGPRVVALTGGALYELGVFLASFHIIYGGYISVMEFSTRAVAGVRPQTMKPAVESEPGE
jgi:hypothetical protein